MENLEHNAETSNWAIFIFHQPCFVLFAIFQISHSIQIHFKIPRLTTRMLTPDNPSTSFSFQKLYHPKLKVVTAKSIRLKSQWYQIEFHVPQTIN